MFDTIPELSLGEQQLPLAQYYYRYPMHDLSPEVKQEIFAQPIDPAEAVPPERFLDWLQPKGEYLPHENAYCMFPDGSGYISTYMRFPKLRNVRAVFWYLNWMNYHCKSQPYGTGNLRYKLWNPADHWTHYFVNWRDKSEGVCTVESLDLGEGDVKNHIIRHAFELKPYGLTEQKIDQIEASGIQCPQSSDWESFDFDGAHLTLGQIRPCPKGGFERRSCEWIGWKPGANGQIERYRQTPCDEAYLRKVANHTLIEWYHLDEFVEELYEAYHDKPNDAD